MYTTYYAKIYFSVSWCSWTGELGKTMKLLYCHRSLISMQSFKLIHIYYFLYACDSGQDTKTILHSRRFSGSLSHKLIDLATLKI